MRIDNSKYELFTKNPEKYRLTYEVGRSHQIDDPNKPALASIGEGRGIVPKKTAAPLADGSAMHFYIEAWNKKWDKDEIKRREQEQGIGQIHLAIGRALAQSFINRYENDDRFNITRTESGDIFSEQEFLVQIPGSPHFIMGKIDELIEFEGKRWIGDYKSANAKATENKKRIEFEFSSQPLFYLNAVRLLGLDPVVGMLYRVITKHTPPQHYIIPVKRNEARLDAALLNIHQVAEMIEMMKRTFGVDVPWPHNYFHYPCNYNDYAGNATCEYSNLCQRPSSELGVADLEQFTPRVSHLELDR